MKHRRRCPSAILVWMPVAVLAPAIFGLAACREDLTRPMLESTSGGFGVQAVEEALAKQGGVVAREGKLFAHSCRSGEISFRIDQIELPAQDSGGHGPLKPGGPPDVMQRAPQHPVD